MYQVRVDKQVVIDFLSKLSKIEQIQVIAILEEMENNPLHVGHVKAEWLGTEQIAGKKTHVYRFSHSKYHIVFGLLGTEVRVTGIIKIKHPK